MAKHPLAKICDNRMKPINKGASVGLSTKPQGQIWIYTQPRDDLDSEPEDAPFVVPDQTPLYDLGSEPEDVAISYRGPTPFWDVLKKRLDKITRSLEMSLKRDNKIVWSSVENSFSSILFECSKKLPPHKNKILWRMMAKRLAMFVRYRKHRDELNNLFRAVVHHIRSLGGGGTTALNLDLIKLETRSGLQKKRAGRRGHATFPDY